MAKFKFKLEFLIKLRKQKEEEKKRKLAIRIKQINTLKSHLNELKNEINNIEKMINEKAKEGLFPAPLYLLYKSHQEKLRLDNRKGEELLNLSKKEEIKDREKLLQANIEHRLIKKLKEKEEKKFKEEEAKKEQDILENLASMTKSRQQTEWNSQNNDNEKLWKLKKQKNKNNQ